MQAMQSAAVESAPSMPTMAVPAPYPMPQQIASLPQARSCNPAMMLGAQPCMMFGGAVAHQSAPGMPTAAASRVVLPSATAGWPAAEMAAVIAGPSHAVPAESVLAEPAGSKAEAASTTGAATVATPPSTSTPEPLVAAAKAVDEAGVQYLMCANAAGRPLTAQGVQTSDTPPLLPPQQGSCSSGPPPQPMYPFLLPMGANPGQLMMMGGAAFNPAMWLAAGAGAPTPAPATTAPSESLPAPMPIPELQPAAGLSNPEAEAATPPLPHEPPSARGLSLVPG